MLGLPRVRRVPVVASSGLAQAIGAVTHGRGTRGPSPTAMMRGQISPSSQRWWGGEHSRKRKGGAWGTRLGSHVGPNTLGHGRAIACDGVPGQGQSGWRPALQDGPVPGERGGDRPWPVGRQEPDWVHAPGTDSRTPGAAATGPNGASARLLSGPKPWGGDLHPHQTGTGSSSCAHTITWGARNHPRPSLPFLPKAPGLRCHW